MNSPWCVRGVVGGFVTKGRVLWMARPCATRRFASGEGLNRLKNLAHRRTDDTGEDHFALI